MPPTQPEPTPDQWQAIEDHLYAGQKIAAIKILREATGCQLVDAKRVVEEHEAKLRAQSPERFASRRAGCGTAVLMLSLAVVCYALW
ncbi:MAG: hypothetical protein GC164_02135 [Phycisphaera sp.]|nr:hypothetical protein [Phycisphaera sp.]